MRGRKVCAVGLAFSALTLLTSPSAAAEDAYSVRGGETLVVGKQSRAGLRTIAPGVYSVRILDPNRMTTYGGQWTTCKTLLCGPGYEDNFDRMGIVLPTGAAQLMQVEPGDVAVYLFDVLATRVE